MLENFDRIALSLDTIEAAAHDLAVQLPELSPKHSQTLYVALMEIRNVIALVAQEVAQIEREIHCHGTNGQS